MNRADGRKPWALRPVKITRNYLKHAEGSVLIEMDHACVTLAVRHLMIANVGHYSEE